MKRNREERLLSTLINRKRTEMMRKAKVLGFTHPSVVAVSQELDDLLNRYQSIG